MQRAPISAATPGSLMELLCRLQTEDRVPWVWPTQDPGAGGGSPSGVMGPECSRGLGPCATPVPSPFLTPLPCPAVQPLPAEGRWASATSARV